MNPNTSPENNKPDYSFITNQQTTDNKPSIKNNKRAVVLIVCLVLLVLTALVSTLFKSKENVKSSQTAVVANVDTRDIVKEYISAIENKDYKKANELYNKSARLPQSQFEKVRGLVFAEDLDFKSCETSDQTQDYYQYKKVVVSCSTIDDTENIDYVFYLTERDGKVGIEKYNLRLATGAV